MDMTKVKKLGIYIEDPSKISIQNQKPTDVQLKSVFLASKTHFDYSERLSGRMFSSSEGASNGLESSRSYGVNFTIHRAPIVVVNYPDVIIAFHTYREYSKHGYNRLLESVRGDQMNFWNDFPILRLDWLRCLTLTEGFYKKLRSFKEEAYRSYFIGSDAPIQWKRAPYYGYCGRYDTFVHFSRGFKSLLSN